jgi:hypothetical protein
MADWHFAKAETFDDLARAHDTWREDYKWDETAETGW